MPHHTYPIDPDGLIVPAVVGLDGYASAARVHAGQPLPTPVRVRAVLDTGSDVTLVGAAVLRQLGIAAVLSRSAHTTAGQAIAPMVEVSLSILGPTGIAGSALVRPDLLAMELPQAPPGIETIIGLDVLRESLLIMDGPGKQFTLAF